MEHAYLDKAARGKIGEDTVAIYLQEEKFTIVARNFRTRFGEVDIIAQKKDLLAFVEVKLRSSQRVDPAELILLSKQKKIIMVAKHFLGLQKNQNVTVRFDVALVEYSGNQCTVRYIQDAFSSFD
jgi:putative endonuclease